MLLLPVGAIAIAAKLIVVLHRGAQPSAALRGGNHLRIPPREKSFRRTAGTSWSIRVASTGRVGAASDPAMHAPHCRSAKPHCDLNSYDDF
jgi:hypothetical protein